MADERQRGALPSGGDDAAAGDAQIIAATRRWVERAVIGLNLCPFARASLVQQRIRFRVSHASDADALVADLLDEAAMLAGSDPASVETSLLVHPYVFSDFLDYNDFLDVADALLLEMELDGILQIASFHPQYRFADTDPEAPENRTNRAPYPTLHLLRESSVEQATLALPDTDAIFRRNIETLRTLGDAGWEALWRDDDGA
ncbi:MAG: DUF1415 domain-containing protein [Lysobacterales bacterium]